MSERAMTHAERQEWRVRDDQCATLVTERTPLDSACLMPMPCAKHAPARGDGPPPPCPRCDKEWPRGTDGDGGEAHAEWMNRTQHFMRCNEDPNAPVCPGCGKRVWPVIHSCKRVRQPGSPDA